LKMLEIGADKSNSGDLIKDVNEDTFMTDVVEVSQEVPVIVDFWAPWCGPCKTLGPMLEKAVLASKGAVRMVKVNIDNNQEIAAQLRVQSIPTVFAFHKGQPIDGFQGALPNSEIDAFVEKVVEAGGVDASGGLSEALDSAEEMLEEGAAGDAAQVFSAIIEEDNQNVRAYSGLARAKLILDDIDGAEAVLNGVPAEIADSSEIDAVFAKIALARQTLDVGPLLDLEAAVTADPADSKARFEYSQALYAASNLGDAVAQLLELFRRDPDWDDGAAKIQLFTIFDALEANDPIVLNGRRKLSSMIFA
jgi:putative thioredoxin